MSTVPPDSVISWAEPPVLKLKKLVSPPFLVVMVAFPAVVGLAGLLKLPKVVCPPSLFVIVAFPAVLVLKKLVDPKELVMVAFSAELVSKNCVAPCWNPEAMLVMDASPALLVS
jgi:hypothetical protein